MSPTVYVIAHSVVLNAMHESPRMREITWAMNGALNVFQQSFSSTSLYYNKELHFGHLVVLTIN